MIKTLAAAAAAAVIAAGTAFSQAGNPAPESDSGQMLTILTSERPQTQLMALILTRAGMQAGADVRILLCDAAGDLALAEPPAAATAPLAPRDMSPHGLLAMLAGQGVTVQVCAIYLPNSDHAEDDLMDGVSVATPPEIAAVMLEPDTRLFTF